MHAVIIIKIIVTLFNFSVGSLGSLKKVKQENIFRGLQILENICKTQTFYAVYAFNLLMAFAIIVIFYNILLRFRATLPVFSIIICLVTLLSMFFAILLFFSLCQNITEKSSKLLQVWQSLCDANGCKNRNLRYWERKVKAMHPIRMPFGSINVSKEFARQYLYETNIVSMNTLMIGTLSE